MAQCQWRAVRFREGEGLNRVEREDGIDQRNHVEQC